MEHDLNIKTLFTLIYFLSSYPYIKGNLEIMHQHLTDRWAPNQFLSRSTRPSDLITNHCKSILSNLHVRTHEKTPEEFQYLALTTPIWKLLCCAVITSIYHFQLSLKFKCIIFRPIWEKRLTSLIFSSASLNWRLSINKKDALWFISRRAYCCSPCIIIWPQMVPPSIPDWFESIFRVLNPFKGLWTDSMWSECSQNVVRI